MGIENLHKFLNTFFNENQCQVEQQTNEDLTIQLSPELDEQLMNRPFYWQYMKKMGLEGEPSRLYLTVNPNKKDEDENKYEFIHFGSPRLQQIIQILLSKGKYVKLYQSIITTQHTPLIPWLVLNIKISYIGKDKKEVLKSIGINMVNGAIINEFIHAIRDIQWGVKISDFCYTLTPLIQVKHSYQRIMQLVEEMLQQETHEWAATSWGKMEKEKNLLKQFYQSEEDSYQNHYQKELEAIESIYQPKIDISIVNGGMFFITQYTSFKLLNS
ncbi:Bacterial protein YqhG of unknown function [Paraliobacillus sp. PM-2]|uniref:YqhG family protein n=1 Tax=Paraliobacillus sp. PM-2 TaxID=1462524 RepID=UPI00061B8F89|nr:YqhG family protein [Paraliobacillus sp. PM-2]CQR46830.1 Bacterial protein YqhG of unknown function [Paraliobacillus sp. PM-2]